MSAAPLQQGTGNIDALVAKIREVAVLPHVVYKVLEVSGSADTSTAEVERAIVVDPGFSSRLLTVVNSAYYALPRKITSIREAVLFLGLRTIRQIAMTVGLYDMFVGKTDKESLRRRTWWRHSVDTAVCARYVAKQTGKLGVDEAYTCGLLHLIGKTLLDRFGGKDYERVEQLIHEGYPDVLAEREVYGCDHTEVAVAAAQKWGFPDSLVASLSYLEPPAANDPHGGHRAVVAVSTKIAQWTLAGAAEEIEPDERKLPQWAIDSLGVPPEREIDIIEGAKTAITEAAAMNL